MTKLYTNISAIEPLLPTRDKPHLEALALDLVRETSRLSGLLNPITRSAVRDLLRLMNSFLVLILKISMRESTPGCIVLVVKIS